MGKSHATKREIKTLYIFFFRMKPPCLVPRGLGESSIIRTVLDTHFILLLLFLFYLYCGQV